MEWKAVRVFVNNEPDRFIVGDGKFKGMVLCSFNLKTNQAEQLYFLDENAAQTVADTLNWSVKS